ncbi:MAG: DNA polymerase I [bacterium]|nr:DNA polymerase I [bacterium]
MSLILVDGSALVYRAHYAFAGRPLTAPSGEVTSVAFGFCHSVLSLVESRRPERLAVVFDRKGPNFRHAMYPEYKAHRKPMPPELAEQLPRLHELLAAWGVPVLGEDGVEADDVMATVAARAAARGEQAWLYSGDKDFLQLLGEHVGILKPGKHGDEVSEVTADTVRRDFGLEPAALVDVFALSGDKADNIPGAPGVGDKTALKLIQEFGTLENLFDRLEGSTLTPRLKRVIGENRELVLLSRDLFRIRRDVPVELDWDRLGTALPVSPPAQELLGLLGLRRVQTLAGKLAAAAPNAAPAPATPATSTATTEPGQADAPRRRRVPEVAAAPAPPAPDEPGWRDRCAARGYVRLADDASLAAWLAQLDPQAALAVDTETDSLRAESCRLVGISLAGAAQDGTPLPPAYIPVRWRDSEPGPAAEGSLFPAGREHDRLQAVAALLAPVLASDCLKVGQNLKYDEWVLVRHGLPLDGPRFDTMLASYVLDPGRRSHGLDDLVGEFLEHRMMPYDELFERGDRRRDILAVDPWRLALYAAEDADYTLRLHAFLSPLLDETGLRELFAGLEMPVSAVLLRMERNGIRLDRAFLGTLRRRFEQELTELQKRIVALAGQDFNVNSSQQLAVILFEKLKLTPIKKTSTGWSTDVSVLSVLAEEHELPAAILEYRQVAKLQSTYVETLPLLADETTGLVHTSYNQAVAATGRLSSSDPNLQNIPIRTDLGRQIRRAFVPRAADNVFLSADYSQVELRLLAHLADDPGLQAAFRDGADVHRRTAALINGIAEDQVTSEMRSRAKAINFGVIYGMGARALARQTGVPVKEATAFIDRYFATYPGVRAFIETTRESARRHGWVQTMLGRRRLLPDITSADNRTRAFQERVAVNTPIQGTAADLIKLAMLRIQAALDAGDSGALLLLQVHDELVLEVPRASVEAVTALVRDGMEGALTLKVPLVVDIHTGSNWAEAHG